MEFSVLIVSHNRKSDLELTLTKLESIILGYQCEVLVVLDACTDNSELLIEMFPWVQWEVSNIRLWASPARRYLYDKAKGNILIGLDDDAHPLQADFLEATRHIFDTNPDIGIIAYDEVKGVFDSDELALELLDTSKPTQYVSSFVGCGFAITSSVYEQTQGFPAWMDIYCEENCVAIEVLSLNYGILSVPKIAVNHRVNQLQRKKMGRHYFRFKKQLYNEANYYLVYYRNPSRALLRLFWNNFKTYAIRDVRYLNIWLNTGFRFLLSLTRMMKYRKPVGDKLLKKIRQLPNP